MNLSEQKTRFSFRTNVIESDIEAVRFLVADTGVFSDEEITIAGELAEEHFLNGEASGYNFLFAYDNANLAGYTCFGRIPFTDNRYDLYWIAVSPEYKSIGFGQELYQQTENLLYESGCKIVYAETSSRDCYKPAHNFYLRMGFKNVAVLKDFYKAGDSKIIFEKNLERK